MLNETSFHPKAAMVLSAGLGKRMRPITATTPKPLIEVNGVSMLARAASRLKDAGLETCIVNVHYLADLVETHARKVQGLDVKISDERQELLDTGGGVKKALPMLGKDPFIIKNSDSFWLEGVKPNLDVLVDAWNDDQMDILLLLAPTVNAVGYDGKGDFLMSGEGRLERRDERSVAPFIYSGTAMVHPRLFADTPDGPFSMNLLFDRAIENERCFGVEGDGLWLHVGTPQGLVDAEQAIANSAN